MRSITKIDAVKHRTKPSDRTAVRIEMLIDTSDELPEVDELDGYSLYQGSIALIITESKLAILSSDGKWYINGEAVE